MHCCPSLLVASGAVPIFGVSREPRYYELFVKWEVHLRGAGAGPRCVEVYFRDSEDRPLYHGKKDWYFQHQKFIDGVDLDSWRSGRGLGPARRSGGWVG
eukprot:726400-Alexandrium_andersonii.AAC.1